MAPTKSSKIPLQSHDTLLPLQPVEKGGRKMLARRPTATNSLHDQNADVIPTRAKRKAEHSPGKNEKVKRSALGNVTNNVITSTVTTNGIQRGSEEENQHHTILAKKSSTINLPGMVLRDMQNTSIGAGGDGTGPTTRHQQQQQLLLQKLQSKPLTRAATRNANSTVIKPLVDVNSKDNIVPPATVVQPKKKDIPVPAAPPQPPACTNTHLKGCVSTRRISVDFTKNDESLYLSALDDFSSADSMRLSGNFAASKRLSAILSIKQQLKEEKTDPDSTNSSQSCEDDETKKVPMANLYRKVPDGVEDFDKANWDDPFQVSHYAMDIFEYLKGREPEFVIGDYMTKQKNLSVWMRTLLVDWMVEVQETFELNHETLYLAVKIVDLYLCDVVINKNRLQLLGAAALLIASKYDERTPPMIEDFLYICDGAYKHRELILMEMNALHTIGYDLGMPLSYRFLRRYARCARVTIPTLTLARFILEMSLMDYNTVSLSDSKLACAALFMALRMHNHKVGWTPTLEYYSGYKLTDFAEYVPVLNANLPKKVKNAAVKTVRRKYSHKIFHEVAKVKLLTTEELFENNLDLNMSQNDLQSVVQHNQQQGIMVKSE